MIAYFVSFSHASPRGSGFGSTWITRDAPVSDMEGVREMARSIESANPVRNVVVLNWRRFEDPK